jgi:hypothetical protein
VEYRKKKVPLVRIRNQKFQILRSKHSPIIPILNASKSHFKKNISISKFRANSQIKVNGKKNVDEAKYVDKLTRGDETLWVGGNQSEDWPYSNSLEEYGQKLGTL